MIRRKKRLTIFFSRRTSTLFRKNGFFVLFFRILSSSCLLEQKMPHFFRTKVTSEAELNQSDIQQNTLTVANAIEYIGNLSEKQICKTMFGSYLVQLVKK